MNKQSNNEMNKQSTNEMIQKYMEEMTEQEKLVLKIAQDHLGTSFDIEKSIGFKEWIKNRK